MRTILLVMLVACGGGSTTAPATTTARPAATGAPDWEHDQFAEAPKTGVCANHPSEFGPFVLDANQAAMRYGLTATKYSDAPSTQNKAIEVCGARGEEAWLQSRTCANGNHGGRDNTRGDVGRGGQCGAIVDVFEVSCPEGKLEVFIDMYQCGPNEDFM